MSFIQITYVQQLTEMQRQVRARMLRLKHNNEKNKRCFLRSKKNSECLNNTSKYSYKKLNFS